MVRDNHLFWHRAYARSPANTVYKRIYINAARFVYRHSHAGGMNDRSVIALVTMETVVHLQFSEVINASEVSDSGSPLVN